MKARITLTLLFTTLLWGILCAQSLDYEMKNASGDWVLLEELKGEELTVIDFWATWCKPCIKALPKINDLSESFEKQGVKFVGVNVDGPRNASKVNPFIKSLGINYPVILDPDKEIQEDLNVSVLPTLLILNSSGKEIYRHEGFNFGDENHIEVKIKELLLK